MNPAPTVFLSKTKIREVASKISDLVSERNEMAVKVDSAFNFTLGDLLMEAIPSRVPEAEQMGLLQEIVAEAGDLTTSNGKPMTAANLKMFRYVSERWPADKRRSDISWTSHQEMAGHPDRFEIIAAAPAGFSKRQAKIAVGNSSDTALTQGTAAQKAKAMTNVIEKMSEEDLKAVALALAASKIGDKVADSVIEAQIAEDEEAYDRLRGRGCATDTSISEAARLASRAYGIARKIDDWTEEARKSKASEDDKQDLLAALDAIIIAAAAAKNHIESTDAAFAALLKEK